MLLGSIALLVIVGIFLMRPSPIKGLPMALPARSTVLFGEFTAPLPSFAAKSVESLLGFGIAKNLTRLAAGTKLAVALIEKEGSFFPILLIEGAADKASFSVPTRIINAVTVASKTEEALSFGTEAFSPLGAARNFIVMRSQLANKYFFYAQPQKIKSYFYNIISFYVPSLLTQAGATEVGAGFDLEDAHARGTIFSFSNGEAAAAAAQPFTAQLLPFVPAESDQLFGGVDLASQLSQTDSTLSLASSLVLQYFPGLDFKTDIAPLLEREFALSLQSNHFVAVVSVPAAIGGELISRLRGAFRHAAPFLNPARREVTLPDGSGAYELVPDRATVKEVNDMFEGIEIHGFLLGTAQSYFDAFVNDKWFVSNDIISLKQSLALIRNDGLSAYESQRYKNLLRPLLKNPQLFGSAPITLPTERQAIFTFAKRSFSYHSESEFLLTW